MRALFQEAGVVDDPGCRWRLARHRLDGVLRGKQTDLLVTPVRIPKEVKQSLMVHVHQRRIPASAGRQRFRALALAIGEQPIA
jgi:hypothetical protein